VRGLYEALGTLAHLAERAYLQQVRETEFWRGACAEAKAAAEASEAEHDR